ncbi:MAG TPA: hypothetical protein VIU40_15910, partial [Geobacteraceae bacterium]
EMALSVSDPDHGNISWLPYPALFSARWLRREVGRLEDRVPAPTFVGDADEGCFPRAREHFSYADLERFIDATQSKYFAG